MALVKYTLSNQTFYYNKKSNELVIKMHRNDFFSRLNHVLLYVLIRIQYNGFVTIGNHTRRIILVSLKLSRIIYMIKYRTFSVKYYRPPIPPYRNILRFLYSTCIIIISSKLWNSISISSKNAKHENWLKGFLKIWVLTYFFRSVCQ